MIFQSRSILLGLIWAICSTQALALPSLPSVAESNLQKNVDFWITVYTRYSSTQGLIHDAKYVDHIYEVIDFGRIPPKLSHKVSRGKAKWKAILLSVHQKQAHPELMNADEKKIYDLFQDINEPNKFLNAAHRKRLRFQLGQKDRFLDGLYQSGRFLEKMEEIFKKEGIPVELTRLPFVESSFNIHAFSKVGASGIWQFMRSTAQLFIRANDAVDERNDPIRATEAAAQLLRLNYDSLKNWPLAVTAYNHGRKGLLRAVRKVGSDELPSIMKSYHVRSFGFASGNFFAELLAAVEVEKNAEKYFGKVERARPIDYVEVKIPDYIEMKQLMRQLDLNPKTLKELNPGLTEAVFSGKLWVPAGYHLRVSYPPSQSREAWVQTFWDAYARVPDSRKHRNQRSG